MLSQHLGLMPQLGYQAPGQAESKSLALLSGQDNVEDFKQALVTAKKDTLPALFKENERLGEVTKARISVPLEKLFNVSAYQQGDFKRFFADPRTREKYLEWAPLLLSAEDYVNGKLDAQLPLGK